jgi:dihydropyrimidine dehydrogenase (NAD+) subunit PreA
MGSAVGQVPEYACQITEWAKEAAKTPVIVKLTPNISDIRFPARAARKGGANAVSLINTINSVTGIDLDTLVPRPDVAGKSAHGGYCGPAVKPIALSMLAEVARDAEVGLPISGIGGVSSWRDAAEFLLLGASTVQVCTAVMHYGFRIIEDLTDGLGNWLAEQGASSVQEVVGRSVSYYSKWEDLDLNYKVVAEVDQSKCIGCGLCYTACEDGAHQSIKSWPEQGRTHVEINQETCVGCNLCSLVCPVESCISMKQVTTGGGKLTWKDYAKDPSKYPHLGPHNAH